MCWVKRRAAPLGTVLLVGLAIVVFWPKTHRTAPATPVSMALSPHVSPRNGTKMANGTKLVVGAYAHGKLNGTRTASYCVDELPAVVFAASKGRAKDCAATKAQHMCSHPLAVRVYVHGSNG